MTETQVDNLMLTAQRDALITELTRWVTGAGYPSTYAREIADRVTNAAVLLATIRLQERNLCPT